MQPLSENELDDMVTRERDRGAPPLTDWDSLSTRLRAEGLIRKPMASSFASSALMKIAAGLVLAVGGAAVGRYTVTDEAQRSNSEGQRSNSEAQRTAATPSAEESALLTSNAVAQFTSPEQAWEVLNRAGDEYQRASAYLSERNNEVPMPPSTDQYRTRLAALDNVMSEMSDAMKEAPQDPVINQYYLATVGAREATLRQLGTTLPAGAKLNRF